MTAELITLPKSLNVLAGRIRDAYARTERGRSDWIEGTLDLAAALAEARAQFPADRQFSVWLAENDLDALGKDDRAALLGIAEDPALARRVLQETKRSSWQHIWREEILPWVRHVTKPDLPSTEAEKMTVGAALAATAAPAKASESAPISTDPPPATAPLSPKHPFRGLPRGDELAAVYLDIKGRTAIGRFVRRPRIGREIWDLMLAALDGGILTPTPIAFASPTLRLLFPDAARGWAQKFDLTHAPDRRTVRERILPALIARGDAVRESPGEAENIVAAYWNEREGAVRREAETQRIAAAVEALPEDQREVVMFGVRLWPRIDHKFGTYDYDQLCAAIWLFRDLQSGFESGAPSPQSRAILIRHSMRWLMEYFNKIDLAGDLRLRVQKPLNMVHLIARLFEQDPSGPCVMPPTPKIEGQE